jgi:nucleoside-diphosphate-sugar epimerase
MTTDTLRHEVYNISSGVPATNRDFAEALERARPGLRVDLLPGRPAGDPPAQPYLGISRLTADTGFHPRYDLDAAVADYLAWLTHHER